MKKIFYLLFSFYSFVSISQNFFPQVHTIDIIDTNYTFVINKSTCINCDLSQFCYGDVHNNYLLDAYFSIDECLTTFINVTIDSNKVNVFLTDTGEVMPCAYLECELILQFDNAIDFDTIFVFFCDTDTIINNANKIPITKNIKPRCTYLPNNNEIIINNSNHNNYTFELYNISGQIIYKKIINSNIIHLNEQLPENIYIYKMYNKDILFSDKILIHNH